MKKYILATTALVALGGTAHASEPIELRLDGYMEQWWGYAGSDDTVAEEQNINPGEFHSASDAEVHFRGTTTLDNGIQIEARLELEGNTANDQMDEVWMRFSGKFGSVQLGSDDTASEKMHIVAPNAGFIDHDDGDLDQWVAIPDNNDLVPDTHASYVSDSQKITYMTPKISGFQLGASFTPEDGLQDANRVGDQNGNAHNGISVALAYEGEFSGVGLEASVGYERVEIENNAGALGTMDEDDISELYAIGLSVNYGDFTIGGAFQDGDADDDGNDLERTDYSVGLAYERGDYAVSFGWSHVTVKDETTANVNDDEDKMDIFELGAGYSLGQGVEWQSSIMYADFDGDEVNAAGTALAQGSESGDAWVAATGFRLSF